MSEQEPVPVWKRGADHLWRWGLDVLALLLLLAVGLWFLPGLGAANEVPPSAGMVEYLESNPLPFWATVDDLLLVGPDAGAWASSAQAVLQGNLDALDEHRMPTFSIVTAGVMLFQRDVALAGHWLNHAAMLLLPLLLYGLGRIGGGRAVGLGAGFLVACLGPLLNASRLYGVDPLIFTILPASLLLTAAVRKWWWLAPVAGLVVAMATVTHFTTLPMCIPPLLLLILWGPRCWWRRLLAVGLFLVTGAGLLWLLFQVFPFPTTAELAHNVSEGIAPGSGSTLEPSLNKEALSILEAGAGTAVDTAVMNVMLVLRPAWLPWHLALALPWVGAVGAGLAIRAKKPGAAPVWKRMLGSFDLALGVVLLTYLAPLPFFAAAQAPDRYGWNLLPFAALLLVRGLGSVAMVIGHGVRALWRRWPLGVLSLGAALAVVYGSWTNGHGMRFVLPPSMDGQEVRLLGQLVSDHFEPGHGAVCTIREASAHAGRHYCPQSPCPLGVNERFFEHCLATIDKECSGDGPVPYVVIQQASRLPHTALAPDASGSRGPAHEAFDAWLLERYQPLGNYEARQFRAYLLSLPREDLR